MSRSNSPKRRHGRTDLPPPPQGECPATGKIRWGERSSARRHHRRLMEKGGDPAKRPLNIYRCKECGSWHVGHKPWDKAIPKA